jgi:hypothetical protein
LSLLGFVLKHSSCDTVRGIFGLAAPGVIVGDHFYGLNSEASMELPVRSGHTRFDLTHVPLEIKSKHVIGACHRAKADHFGCISVPGAEFERHQHVPWPGHVLKRVELTTA